MTHLPTSRSFLYPAWVCDEKYNYRVDGRLIRNFWQLLWFVRFAPIPTEILCNIEVLNVVLKQVSRKKVKLRYKYNTHFHIFLTQYNPSMKPIASSPRQLYWYIWLNVFCGNVLGWIECPKCVASTLFSLYQKHTGLWTIFWAVETPVPDSSSHISSHARALCYQYAPLLGVYKSDPKEKSISSAIWTLSQMG